MVIMMTMILIDMCDVQGWTRDPPLNPSAPRRLWTLSDSGLNNEQLVCVQRGKTPTILQIEAEYYSQIWGHILMPAPHSLFESQFWNRLSNFPDCGFCFWSRAASCATLPLNTTQIKQQKKQKRLKTNKTISTIKQKDAACQTDLA